MVNDNHRLAPEAIAVCLIVNRFKNHSEASRIRQRDNKISIRRERLRVGDGKSSKTARDREFDLVPDRLNFRFGNSRKVEILRK